MVNPSPSMTKIQIVDPGSSQAYCRASLMKASKVCACCKLEKPRGSFRLKGEKWKPNAVSSRCLECIKQIQETKRRAKGIKPAKRGRKLYVKKVLKRGGRSGTAEYHMWRSARTRATKLGIPFDLKIEDIVIPTICPVLGIPLKRNTGQRGHCPTSPSIDRVVPSKGYTRKNIVVMSMRANTLKSDATYQEILKVGEWLAERMF